MHTVHAHSGRDAEGVSSTLTDALKEEEKTTSIIQRPCSAGEKVEQHRPRSTLVPLSQPLVTTAALQV